MNVLFFGDIYGKPGRRVLAEQLPVLREKYAPDFVIANVENMTHGKGVSEKHLKELSALGVDIFTTGNHAFKQRKMEFLFEDANIPLIRPENFSKSVPGVGARVFEKNGKEILVINLIGQVFMPGHYDSPFDAVEKILKEYDSIDTILVDFHAEATSEKIAMQWHLDGRVSAVMGTHTHVQTSDARILPEGTAVMTDVGMNGPEGGVLGVKKEIIIKKFFTNIADPQEVDETGPCQMNAVSLQFEQRKALHITPLLQYSL